MADINMLVFGDGAGKKIHKKLYKTNRYSLAFASGTTEKSFTINATAKTILIILETPVFSGDVVTMTLTVENSDGTEIYKNESMVEDETHNMVTTTPLVGDNTVKVTASTDPLSSGTCYVTMYMEG